MSRLCLYAAQIADENKRLDAVLAESGLYPSRSAAAKAIEAAQVCVNGLTVAKKYTVCAGDTIVYQVEEAVVMGKRLGENIPLDIRYEDDDMIVLSKQAGLVCHPCSDHESGTLVDALIYHCGADNLCNVQGENDRLGIVHRLDQFTTGLMLAAKTNAAGVALMTDIRDRAVDRHYLALVHGVIAHDTGMIDAPIARAQNDRKRMAVRDVPSSREAITTFQVLERFEAGLKDDGYTLIDCKLFTGRTHQIRVHMEYAHHPLVGEPVYRTRAPKDARADLGLTRQFLHSYQIGFAHPTTQESMRFFDSLPEDLTQALNSIKDRSMGLTEAGNELSW